MGLPSEVVQRILDEQAVIGLKLFEQATVRVYWFRTLTKEGPVNLREFSLGTASAMAVAGTGFDQIQNSAGANLLEPALTDHLHQIFFGVNPGYIQVFINYPGNVARLSLRGTRTVGGDTGYIDGAVSPFLAPSVDSELFSVKELNPNFNGFHPFAEPATPTVRINFFITRFQIEYLGQTDAQRVGISGKVAPPATAIEGGRIVTMGGVDQLIQTPAWIRDKP